MCEWKDLKKDGHDSVLATSIRDGVNEKTIECAREFGKYLVTDKDGKKLATNQVRKFFGEVKRLQMTIDSNNSSELRSKFVLLKPKLAYAVGRANKDNNSNIHYKIEDFYNVLSIAIDEVIKNSPKDGLDKKTFKNFIDVFESIVAYHKYAESVNSDNGNKNTKNNNYNNNKRSWQS